MNIALASDHAGYQFKQQIAQLLTEKGYEVQDYGTDSTQSCDYPDFAVAACNAVATQKAQFGILVCGTGIGMSIAANKIAGIRCALCVSPLTASLARQHNDANVLALGERNNDLPTTLEIVNAFLTSSFEGGRHARRVDKLNKLDK